ncbi:histidine kinase [Nakamurella multipartita DSM 44233]|uniref:Sensor histidine kinase MtrB n=1 Tax=Nakamurella multipartita (strain ATCC 700099 / DSM 44233 / CIP 104796 / JCM 9543 / NBRC 105858 / Y-104) TaxID=479431 RepID=C8XJH6_NAKMY|nr:MtrAB system histidine kinase MtrB [Nakamurella multipartita]ACV80537.1 histidine kinase [Nakamurella multipartita DSM 44233]
MSTEPAAATPSPDAAAAGSAQAPADPTAPQTHRSVDSRLTRLRGQARRGLTAARSRIAFWSRSLLVRVVVLTLSLSAVVMITLGLILQQQITAGLLQSKIDAATVEIDNARQTVQNSLSGADSDPNSLREQLQLALTEIGRVDGSSGAQNSTAGVFEPVIVPSRIGSDADLAVAQPLADVPAELRARVSQGNVSYQYTTIRRDGQAIPALVVGSPARTSTDSFEVYLIFPLAGEQGTVQVVQRTLLVGGVALAIALTGISALVAMQVVRPVRRAAASARKLAAGDLAERMPVKGPIELETLASSFNGMAEAIRVQIRQLEEFGKLQRRFTSDVSHELRTPLTTVRMAADMLYDGRSDFPEYLGRSTELLVDELDRFESLLTDLLEISRYDAGMAELSAETIDIRSCIHASIAAAAPLADQFDVQIVTVLPEHAVVAELDTRRVDRILRNLLNNAIDHADGKPVEVELAADPDVLAITVTDHGVGLRPGEAGLVFNRFWRADPSRQRHTGGTGLGLAISLEDARLHGGWLQASGTPGEGARFRLTLPRQHGGLITHSPLALRADGSAAGSGATPDEAAPVRMMVDDGALKPAPREDELHPASVPVGGATAALISPEVAAAEDQPAAPGAPGPAGGAGAASTDAASPVAR